MRVHRLIPSRYPTVNLFDWADSAEELIQIAALEGLTNDRLLQEYGQIHLVPPEDWVGGQGSTPLMAAFTHPGESRFSDGSFGVYYAGNDLETAIAETKFHRERFLKASKEAPNPYQMREYRATVTKELIVISAQAQSELLNPDPSSYSVSQNYGRKIKAQNHWGIRYPSVRHHGGICVAIFRPKALTLPVQGIHLDYIWDGEKIAEIRESILL